MKWGMFHIQTNHGRKREKELNFVPFRADPDVPLSICPNAKLRYDQGHFIFFNPDECRGLGMAYGINLVSNNYTTFTCK